MTPKEILRLEYGDSKNFMTPHILGRGSIYKDKNKIIVYELSKGRGIPRSPFDSHGPVIYAVSIVKYDQNTGITYRMSDYCECSESKLIIKNYINNLKKILW